MSATQLPKDPRAPQVYLVPGFLGFQRLDALKYFDDEVVRVLRAAIRAESGSVPLVHDTPTEATASIARRTARLLAFVAKWMHRTRGPLYFVGHSTGGLDARLLLSPGADVDLSELERQGQDRTALEEALVEIRLRTKGVVSLATPHYGAPLATQAISLNAHLVVGSLAYLASAPVARQGLMLSLGETVHLAAGAWVGEPVRRWIKMATAVFGRDGKLDPSVFDYLAQVAHDQGAIFQLTPQGTNLFNATVADAPAVPHVAVATVTPPPGLANADPLFQALRWLTGRTEPSYGYPPLDEAVGQHLAGALQFAITPGSNDGIVPTLSQLHGRLGAVVVADHLDVVGMFPRESQPGWRRSGAGFRDVELRETWKWIARGLVHPASLPSLPPVVNAHPAPERRTSKQAA